MLVDNRRLPDPAHQRCRRYGRRGLSEGFGKRLSVVAVTRCVAGLVQVLRRLDQEGSRLLNAHHILDHVHLIRRLRDDVTAVRLTNYDPALAHRYRHEAPWAKPTPHDRNSHDDSGRRW